MDYLANTVESLAKQASQITVYDITSTFNKAKAMVLNLSEIEIKVNEATNNDAWGASSTVMQEISQATFNFQLFNEVMPAIYQRFTDKEARQWRQIYKALVLLEYLIKNGSERVIDDARAHLSLVRVLRNFHYIDENGKDQGINVRNRSKEIAELLSDLDRVRQERRKAKANRNKYTGVGNDGSGTGSFGGGPSFTSATGSRYGGFGSDSFEGGSGGGGGGYSGRSFSGGGGSSGGFHDSSSKGGEYEEYDAGDWDDRRESGSGSGSGHRGSSTSDSRASATTSSSSRARTAKATPAPPKVTPAAPPKAPEVNLFDFDDEEQQLPPPPTKVAAPVAALDDDFDDFQSATAAPAPVAASPPAAPHQNVSALLNTAPPAPSAFSAAPRQQAPLSSFAPLQAQSRPAPVQQPSYSTPPLTPGSAGRPTPSPSAGVTKPASDFSDLFSSFGATPTSLSSSSSTAAGKSGGPAPKLSMAELAAQARQNQLFAMSGGAPLQPSKPTQQSGGWDSLL